MRLRVCIMTGCDFLKNLKGIGFRTLMSLYQSRTSKKSLKTMLLKKIKDEEEVQEYLDDVTRTTIGFRHSLVFDRSGQLVYMNADKIKSEGIDRKDLSFFAGEKFENTVAFMQGKLNIQTLQPREPVSVNFKRLTDFLDFVPDNSSGRLNNLCARLVTSDNFDKINRSAKTADEEDAHDALDELPQAKRVKRELLS